MTGNILIKFRNRILQVDSRLRGNDGISVFQWVGFLNPTFCLFTHSVGYKYPTYV